MKERYAGSRRKIIEVVPNDQFALIITFDDGEKRILDMMPILQPDTVFAPFMDINNFRRVYLDENNVISWDVDPRVDSNKVWSNKVDLSPEYCYANSVPAKNEFSETLDDFSL